MSFGKYLHEEKGTAFKGKATNSHFYYHECANAKRLRIERQANIL